LCSYILPIDIVRLFSLITVVLISIQVQYTHTLFIDVTINQGPTQYSDEDSSDDERYGLERDPIVAYQIEKKMKSKIDETSGYKFREIMAPIA
jgi:hypothetical protein